MFRGESGGVRGSVGGAGLEVRGRAAGGGGLQRGARGARVLGTLGAATPLATCVIPYSVTPTAHLTFLHINSPQIDSH